MKIEIELTYADGVTETLTVSLRWLLNHVSDLVKAKQPFVITTPGEKVKYNGQK
jgi:hypothetical protein